MIGTDSHTPNGGGLGSISVGVGGADAVEVMAGLPWEVLYPRLHRRPPHRRTQRLDRAQGHYPVPGRRVDRIRRHQRHHRILRPRRRLHQRHGQGHHLQHGRRAGRHHLHLPLRRAHGPLPARHQPGRHWPNWPSSTHLLAADPEVDENPSAYYDQVVEINLSELEPHLVGPHSPDRARPHLADGPELQEDPGLMDEISSALIGSCTNSSYEDMSRSADVAEQAKANGLSVGGSLHGHPGSEQVRATIERDGQMQSLQDINATVLANACGPCIGQWRRVGDPVGRPNTIVTSYNRNFPARNDGEPPP